MVSNYKRRPQRLQIIEDPQTQERLKRISSKVVRLETMETLRGLENINIIFYIYLSDRLEEINIIV